MNMKFLLNLLGITYPQAMQYPRAITQGGSGRQSSSLETGIKELSDKVWAVPNISDMKIELGSFDPLALANGIIRRANTQLEFHKGPLNGPNRYLKYSMLRLLKLRQHNKSRFWKLGLLLVQHSNCMVMYSTWCIDKNIYRSHTWKELFDLLKSVNELRGAKGSKPFGSDMVFKRTYIPKGDTVRPLGVPSLPWRIYLNMLLQILTIGLELKDSQHGFRPKRGTLTAWKAMFTKVIFAPFMYEIDLKQCFPSISLPKLYELLITKHGMSPKVAELFIRLNEGTPEFKGLILLNETQSLTIQAYHASLKRFARTSKPTDPLDLNPSHPTPAWLASKVKYPIYSSEGSIRFAFELIESKGLQYTGIAPEILKSFLLSLQSNEQVAHYFGKEMITFLGNPEYDKFPKQVSPTDMTFLQEIGTAQGSPLSPLLSAVVINEIDESLPLGVSILKYADDMIYYGTRALYDYVNSGDLQADLMLLGLTLHPGKSSWAKIDGKWVHPIKFLGLTYDGVANSLRAATRKGSTLVFNKVSLLEAEYDLRVSMKDSFKVLKARIVKSYKAGVSQTVILGIPFEIIKNCLSYNFWHHWREIYELKIASEGSYHIAGLILFLRFLFDLPKRILFSLKFNALIRMKDQQAVRDFVSKVFDKEGAVQVPLASTLLLPHDPQDQKIPLPFAPYYLHPNTGITSLLGDLDYHWRERIIASHPVTPEQGIVHSDYKEFTTGLRLNLPRAIAMITLLMAGFFISWLPSIIIMLTLLYFWLPEDLPNSKPAVELPKTTGISSHVESFDEIFILYRFRTIFFTEYNNEYVKKHRSKYTWANFVTSKLAGVIMARMYDGSWVQPLGNQDFEFKFKDGSVAASLQHKDKRISVFTGSTWGCRSVLRALKRITKVRTKSTVRALAKSARNSNPSLGSGR